MKTITMTYIEVLQKKLERKKDELKKVSDFLQSEPSYGKINQRKFIELEAEIRELESCIDLATVMFNEGE